MYHCITGYSLYSCAISPVTLLFTVRTFRQQLARYKSVFMKKHILLIERTRQGYVDFMNVLESSEIDCKVTYTTSYDHALKMLEFLVPDCIFMRVDISEENTIECVRRIRDHDALSRAKIVLYDDEVNGNMIRRSIMQGADYCIDRPTTFGDISHLLKDVFNQHHQSPDRRSSEC